MSFEWILLKSHLLSYLLYNFGKFKMRGAKPLQFHTKTKKSIHGNFRFII